MTGSTDRIEKRILLAAPRERAWEAISEPARFGDWFGARFDGAFAPGARVAATIVPTRVDEDIARLQEPYRGVAFELIVERMEPPRRFAFRWHPGAVDPAIDYSREPTTLVEFALDDAPGGTWLTITESGFDQLPRERRAAARESNDGGWQAQLGLIAKYLAQAA